MFFMRQVGLFILLNLICSVPVIPSEGSEKECVLNLKGAFSELNIRTWHIGGKIHFEERSNIGYIGTREINKITKKILKEILDIYVDSCSSNAKILLKKELGRLKMTHYEEQSRPGIGEELHATLLYTKPRSRCLSETLYQICAILFGKCENPPTIGSVACAYTKIIRPDWKFRISAITLEKNQTGSFYITAKLLFNEQNTICKGNKPISTELHMTLVNAVDGAMWIHKETEDRLIKRLNKALQGKFIKIATKDQVADLEFGISGTSWRIRAGQYIPPPYRDL